ncbi:MULTISPECIES: response regulator transcription factor [Rhizobium/Agrobacterium group]|uniref:response regulator transcription factor n=1 Tax=Rhizobium/Agrobacterium group TaxID=227290 RepID=UPI0010391AF5|nr:MULTISPECIES: response regulator transcription factor [Rhizobium]MBY3053888.1 response regulator transcription factor [Rhizobium laguerreae]MBY5385290.1 response regulator transcription factor [Rhizobium leguminosarum]MBY5788145.1 response regulator transcription factor [Rhizobium leguminosarum]MCA2435558.1 response regulator transcription factor [Rhizobium leguminosarum]NEH73674.1 response regulator [Rhizobium leguminosarum]
MRVLIVEDDRRISSFLRRGLEAEGYHVQLAEDGRDGLERIRHETVDLVILDRMIPYVDGLEVCRIIRQERRSVLVLMLTAKESIRDRVDGLQSGADDYLVKPFAFDELIARIEALRRRRPTLERTDVLQVGSLTLDPATRRVRKSDREIGFTVREFELLRYLMLNVNKVVSRQRLLNNVWNYDFDPGTKIVEVYIRYLRRKLGQDGDPAIRTVRGVGYTLVESTS